jgi:hypothetical protein
MTDREFLLKIYEDSSCQNKLRELIEVEIRNDGCANVAVHMFEAIVAKYKDYTSPAVLRIWIKRVGRIVHRNQ